MYFEWAYKADILHHDGLKAWLQRRQNVSSTVIPSLDCVTNPPRWPSQQGRSAVRTRWGLVLRYLDTASIACRCSSRRLRDRRFSLAYEICAPRYLSILFRAVNKIGVWQNEPDRRLSEAA
jgi:hypothetical protein